MPESMRTLFLLDGLEDVYFVGIILEETMNVPIGGWFYSAVMSQWSMLIYPVVANVPVNGWVYSPVMSPWSMLISLLVANDPSAGMTQWSGVWRFRACIQGKALTPCKRRLLNRALSGVLSRSSV